MPAATFQEEGVSVEVRQESVTVEAAKAPDPDWEYADEEGHRHYYDEGMDLPTLEKRKVDEYWSSLLRDVIEIYRHFCKKCGEQIRPGTYKPPPETIPMQTDITGEAWKDSCPYFNQIVRTFHEDPIDLEIGPYTIRGVRAREVTLHRCEFAAESIDINMEEFKNDESIRTRP